MDSGEVGHRFSVHRRLVSQVYKITLTEQINCVTKRLKLSFAALDSAKTLSPVPRLLKLTLALFYARSTLTKSSSKDLQFSFISLIALTCVCLSFCDFTLGDSFCCSAALENPER